MLLATILAITLIAFYIAVLVGLHYDEGEYAVQALNYPVTFIHNSGESWAINELEDED